MATLQKQGTPHTSEQIQLWQLYRCTIGAYKNTMQLFKH